MSWDYPNPALAAEGEGEGEPTLGFSFGWVPGLPRKPIPAFFSILFLRNAWIPLASAGRKSTGREEKLGLGPEAETKPCWCQAWSCLLPSRWGFIFAALPAKTTPGRLRLDPAPSWEAGIPSRPCRSDLGSLGAERDDEVSLQPSRAPKLSLKLNELGRV